MSNANPLVPQGSVLEQQAKSKPHLRIAVCIVAAHMVFLGLLLMQGCKRDEATTTTSNTTELPPLDAAAFGTETPVTNPPGIDPLAFGAGATNTLDAGLGVQPYGAVGGGTGVSGSTQGSGVAPAPLPGFEAVPMPQEAAPAATEHVVKSGDTFSSLGRKYNVTATAIAKANPGVDPRRLQVGQKLVIPAPSAPTESAAMAASSSDVYVVKKNDTLSKIAREHGTTYQVLMEINGLKTARLDIGQKLRLPAKPAAVEPPAAYVPSTSNVPFVQ